MGNLRHRHLIGAGTGVASQVGGRDGKGGGAQRQVAHVGQNAHRGGDAVVGGGDDGRQVGR